MDKHAKGRPELTFSIALYSLSITLRLAAEKSVCVKECIYCNSCEAEADDGRNDDTDNLESLHPSTVCKTYRLEHAPETVVKMEPYCYEPYDVDDKNPYASECIYEKVVRIHGLFATELEELHLSPEMSKVEEQDTEDNDTKNKHVLS